MGRILTILFSFFTFLSAIEIQHTPIDFSKARVELTKRYIKEHYGLDVDSIKIVPKIIVVHHTAIDDFYESFSRLSPAVLPTKRADIYDGSMLNVSAHFLIDRDGTIHQLMPPDYMARHVIGLNYNSIGIENVGGESSKDNLTNEQLRANIELIRELKRMFPSIEYLIGHYEYRCFEKSKLWLEKDNGYRTLKDDPSKRFMMELRKELREFQEASCD
ncbi:MAG: N-acetylmuramoyl-L-alanine amidase [Campylobacterota bacterium]|nr:N-acetylmuramoyl-L-alanine amidase [Campylobacterota bacterium]